MSCMKRAGRKRAEEEKGQRKKRQQFKAAEGKNTEIVNIDKNTEVNTAAKDIKRKRHSIEGKGT